MSTLGDIKIRVADCQTYHFGMGVADKLAHEDAPKLIAALEAVEALHVPILEYGDPVGCRTCDWEADGEWPCQTLAAITEALQ